MPDFALVQLLRFHCGFWKSTWASPHRGRWRNNHTPTQGCRLRSVGPNTTITRGLVSARTLLRFPWICNVESKVFHGHGQWNLCPALHYLLWAYREWFSERRTLKEHRGVIIGYLCEGNKTKEYLYWITLFILFHKGVYEWFCIF